jgi:SAM-dependent methyltransferase
LESTLDIELALGVEELRAGFLVFSRETYGKLPPMEKPRILDIGCGSGLLTLELAALGGGEIVGIDIDAGALSKLRQRIAAAELSRRITVIHGSLLESGLPDASFDLLWEEGVLHMLDPSRSFPECRRLVRPGGHLVMHETLNWFEGVRKGLSSRGFQVADEHLLPKHHWWNAYGKPLEERIQAFRQTLGDAEVPAGLARYEQEVEVLKNDPEQFDCGFFALRKN